MKHIDLEQLLEIASTEINSITGYDLANDPNSMILIYECANGRQSYEWDEASITKIKNKVIECNINALSKETKYFLSLIEVLDDLQLFAA